MENKIKELKKECDSMHEKNKQSIERLKERIKKPSFKLERIGQVVERITSDDNRNEE